MSPIFAQIARNDAFVLAELLAKGENVEEKDEFGRTPLMHAVIEGKEAIVQLLLKSGSKLDAQDNDGYSALHFAAQNYKVAIAKVLIDSGASIDIQDSYGNTPLWRATFNSQGRGEMISLLLSCGADKDLKNRSGRSPVELAGMIANYDVKPLFERKQP